MAEQLELFPEEPKKDKPADTTKVDKARAKTVENKEFADKRVKASPIVAETELAKMRELQAEIDARQAAKSGRSIKGSGSGAGGTMGDGPFKSGKILKPNYKSGGKVKSASARADGCAIRGKTRA